MDANQVGVLRKARTTGSPFGHSLESFELSVGLSEELLAVGKELFRCVCLRHDMDVGLVVSLANVSQPVEH